MTSRRRTLRSVLCTLALTAPVLAWSPTAAAQSVPDMPAVALDAHEYAPDNGLLRNIGSLVEHLAVDVPANTNAVQDNGQTTVPRRDSLKNGMIIGATVVGLMSVFGTQIADCPNAAERCPGMRALGLVLGTAMGAGIGAGIDALLTVDTTHRAVTPTGGPRRIAVAHRVTW